ncbi:hypothetical protein BKA70DRAFT_1570185 [Coprinopsis sp. MPI-PUGE-AT-0042]|nr:hypothetical protein BKA70DRAFT_1570185 [Coprinopsis sp. MPI-PUGE-AT-0042]
MAARRRETHDDQHGIACSGSRRTATANQRAQEEEITRLKTREQRLKRKIRVLQSVNEETRVELEELRGVVETLVETVASSNGLNNLNKIRPIRLSCTSGLLGASISLLCHEDAHKRIASLEAQLANREAELAKSLVSVHGRASLGGRTVLGKPSLGVALEAETVAQALDWAVSRNKALEVGIGMLADKINTIRTTTYAGTYSNRAESTSNVAIDAFERAERGLVQPHLELFASPAKGTWANVVARLECACSNLDSDKPYTSTFCNPNFNAKPIIPHW